MCRVSAFRRGVPDEAADVAAGGRNMGSAGTKRGDEEETWRRDLSGA